MHARTGELQVSPDRIDDAVGVLRGEHIPGYRDQSGYKGFTALADRSTGRLIGISFWEDEAALSAADELGEATRRGAMEAGGGSEEPQVGRWEVVLDDTP